MEEVRVVSCSDTVPGAEDNDSGWRDRAGSEKKNDEKEIFYFIPMRLHHLIFCFFKV
jgi:hypothetical protein